MKKILSITVFVLLSFLAKSQKLDIGDTIQVEIGVTDTTINENENDLEVKKSYRRVVGYVVPTKQSRVSVLSINKDGSRTVVYEKVVYLDEKKKRFKGKYKCVMTPITIVKK